MEVPLRSLSSRGGNGGPSARLPIELLSEIFLLCVDDRMDNQNTIHTPLLLSKICSRWRHAATNNPHLWSRLSVQLIGTTSNLHPEIIDTWLNRSGGCPLTIYVFWEVGPFYDTHDILDKLMGHAERWKTMFFYLPICAFPAFSAVRGRLNMLTELSLGTGDDIPSSSSPRKFSMFQIAPRLRSVEIVNFPPTLFEFPVHQLEDIPLLSGNIAECLEFLDKAKRLMKTSYIFVEGGPPAPSSIFTPPILPISPAMPRPYRQVYHTHLLSLNIMTPPWNEFVDLSPLFPNLKLPNLEKLSICNLNSNFGEVFTQFLSGLNHLKTLHLRKTSLPDDQLVEGLKHLPSLTHLIVLSNPRTRNGAEFHNHINAAPGGGGGGVVEEPTVTRYLFEALTRNFFSSDEMEVGMLLPRLKHLELTVSSSASRELDAFIDMLQSRLRAEDEFGYSPSSSPLYHDRDRDGGGSDSPSSAQGQTEGHGGGEAGGAGNTSPTSLTSTGGLARLDHVRVRPCVELGDEFLIRLIELRDLGLEVEVEEMSGVKEDR